MTGRGRPRTRPLRAVLLAASLVASVVAWTDAWAGSAALRTQAQLFSLLRELPACCVIDARSDAARTADPMTDALQYDASLRLAPTSHAVVVADSDRQALAVARRVAAGSRHAVHAVQGGVAAWRAVEGRLQAEAARPGSRYSFVIPHNTCEQGPPLQVFKAARPASAASGAAATK